MRKRLVNRADSHLSGARIVRKHALTEPTSRREKGLGARLETPFARPHHKHTCCYSDTTAGKMPSPILTMTNAITLTNLPAHERRTLTGKTTRRTKTIDRTRTPTQTPHRRQTHAGGTPTAGSGNETPFLRRHNLHANPFQKENVLSNGWR